MSNSKITNSNKSFSQVKIKQEKSSDTEEPPRKKIDFGKTNNKGASQVSTLKIKQEPETDDESSKRKKKKSKNNSKSLTSMQSDLFNSFLV